MDQMVPPHSCADQQSRSSSQNPIPVKPRAVLTKTEVLAVFKFKDTNLPATKVARFYGVSEKAIRDIWTGRTWAAETWHLDTSRELKVKISGRPLGSRDSKPRKKSCDSKPREKRKSSQFRCGSTTPVIACKTSNNKQGTINAVCILEAKFDPRPQNFESMSPVYCDDIIFIKQDRPSQIYSVDDQLFEWNRGLSGGHSPNLFEADWLAICNEFLE